MFLPTPSRRAPAPGLPWDRIVLWWSHPYRYLPRLFPALAWEQLKSSGVGWGAAPELFNIPRLVRPAEPRARGARWLNRSGLVVVGVPYTLPKKEWRQLEQPRVLALGSCWFSWGRLCWAVPWEGWEWAQDEEFGVSCAPVSVKEHKWASIRIIQSRQGVNGRGELGMPWKPFQWRTGILARFGSSRVVFAILQPSPPHLSPRQNEKVCPLRGPERATL